MRTIVDKFMGYVIGPSCTLLLFLASGNRADRSSALDLGSAEAWILFLMLLATHLAGGQSCTDSPVAGRSPAGTLVRGGVACIGILCFHVRRLASPPVLEDSLPSDYHFFRSFSASFLEDPDSPASRALRYCVQTLLLLWLGLLACRWFSEVCGCVFYSHCYPSVAVGHAADVAVPDESLCSCLLPIGSPVAVVATGSVANGCICCESVRLMKDDVDDACVSIAVAGILLGAYAISSRPLPETQSEQLEAQGHLHYLSMLTMLSVLVGVIVAVRVLHAGIRLLLFSKHHLNVPVGSGSKKTR